MAAALLTIGGGVFYGWWRHHKPSSFPALADSRSADHVEMNQAGDGSASTRASPPIAIKANPRTSSLRQHFEQSRDLYGLVQELKATGSGDPETETIIADALYECVAIAQPAGTSYMGAQQAEKQHPELKTYVEGLIATDKQRCGRFVKSDIGNADAKSIVRMYAKAASDGSAKAMAIQLQYSNIDAMPDAALAADVQRIIASRDPDAIGALSNLMGGRAEDRSAAFGPMSGNETQQYAWLMAACQMGMNCGPGSSLLRQYCLNAGVCGYTSINQVIASNYLTPADYHTAVQQAQQIVKSLSAHH